MYSRRNEGLEMLRKELKRDVVTFRKEFRENMANFLISFRN